MEVVIKEFRFKKVHSNIPQGHYPHELPEVVREERERTCTLIRGNRVKVVDGSYNFDLATGRGRNGIDHLFVHQTATVLEIGCNRFVEGVLGWNMQTDLLLLFEDGTEVYCASDCVRLLSDF